MASGSPSIGTGTWIILTVLLMLLALAVYVMVSGWSSAGEPGSDISTAGYVAMALGIVFTLALGIGLMALIFYGNRRQ
jgi:VIT1/CCC1 family predicted Fe2+/Mn2+ transporter